MLIYVDIGKAATRESYKKSPELRMALEHRIKVCGPAGPSLRQVSIFASANAVVAISGACLANSLYMPENALVPGREWSQN